MRYSESRARYAETLDHEPVVIVSLEDNQSLKETAYLLRSPANVRGLLDAIDRLEAGGGTEHDQAQRPRGDR